MKLTDVLSDERKWNRGVCDALDVWDRNINPDHEDARSWSLEGAAQRITVDEDFWDVLKAIGQAFAELHPDESRSWREWERLRCREWPEVYAVAQRADEILEAQV